MNKLILALTLALSGCYQTVNNYDIKHATEKCKGVENIYKITADFLGYEYVTCMDSTYGRIGLEKP